MLPLSLVIGSSALMGCRAHREPLYARESISSDRIYVRVSDAHVRGERVFVKTWVHNQSDKPMVVYRSDLALRLGDGTLLPGPRGRRAEKPIVIEPGRARTVKVGFIAPDRAELSSARLVMSGVQIGHGGPRTLGEIGLSKRASFILADPVRSGTPAEDQEAEMQAQSAEEPSDEEVEAVEADAAEGEAAEPEDSGAWQIGAN
ncbi:MAG: hypothetical protein HOW73_26290 [Polyangiaceae bacterium]|nr:hypothetical protein [Polyangiaceae bacterium]